MAFITPKQIVSALALKGGEKVADFGAGAGHIARELARAVGLEGEVFLIDIQSELLTKVKHIAKPEELKVMRFLTGDLEVENGSHLKDECVDVVVAANMLFQLENKDACLREANRILRAGGRLLIIDWSESFGGIGPQPEHVFPKETARATAERVGFMLVHDIPAGDYHYGFLFQKPGAS